MPALASLAAAALVVAPVPASVTPASSPADDSEKEALALYDRGAFLEAAKVAITGYVSPFSPAATRLRNARLAQEALSKAYANESTPRPEYLCRALNVLEATRPLAVGDEDVELHQTLSASRRATLAARHPGHVCEAGTELIPVVNSGRKPQPVLSTSAGPSLDASESKNTYAPRESRAPFALKTSGAVAVSFGVAALAAMVGGLVVRSQAIKAADPLVDVKKQQGEFTLEQGHQLAALTNAENAARQVALAGGISGAFLLMLGAALIGRGQVLRARTRVAPMAAPGRAGIFVEGRF